MSTVAEIEIAIEGLPLERKLQLRDWLLEQPWSDADEDVAMPRSYQRKVLDVLDQP